MMKWRWTTKKWTLLLLTIIFSLLFLPFVGHLMAAPTALQHKIDGVKAQKMVANEAYYALRKSEDSQQVTRRLENEIIHLESLLVALEEGNVRGALPHELAIAKSRLVGIRGTNPTSPKIQQQEARVAQLQYFIDHPDKEVIDFHYAEKLPLLPYLAGIFQQIPGGLFFLCCGLFMAASFCKPQFAADLASWEKWPSTSGGPQRWGATFQRGFGWCLALVGGAFGGVSLLVCLKDGLGDGQLPLYYHDFAGQLQAMTLWQYLLRCSVSLLLGLLLLAVGASVLARFTKRLSLHLGVLALLLLPSLFPELHQLVNERVAQFLPMSYLDLPKFILMTNPWQSLLLSWEKGLTLCLILVAFLVAVGQVVDRRKKSSDVVLTSDQQMERNHFK